MMLYKITTIDHKTRPGKSNELTWAPGVTHTANGQGGLCSDGYIHAYEHPGLAVTMNPIHAGYSPFVLWECGGIIVKRDGQLKCGCSSLTTIKIIESPSVALEQRVRFAIFCAKQVCPDQEWNTWADNWLAGTNRAAADRAAARVADARVADARVADARVAAWSAAWSAVAAGEIDFVSLLEQAIKEEIN